MADANNQDTTGVRGFRNFIVIALLLILLMVMLGKNVIKIAAQGQ